MAPKLRRSVRTKEQFQRVYRKTDLIKCDICRVYEGHRISDNTPVIIKMLKKRFIKKWETRRRERVPVEVSMLLQLSHIPGVVKIIDYFDEDDRYYTFVMKKSGSVDMEEYMLTHGSFSEEKAKKCLKKIAQSLLQCKNAGIFHRDIKDSNIGLNAQTLKPTVLDFGLAAYSGEESQGLPRNKNAFVFLLFPPEAVQGGPYEGNSGTVWALGLLLYKMLFNRNFIKDRSEIPTKRRTFPRHISMDCKDFLRKCLEKDPSKRLEFEQMLDHPWF